MSILAISSNRTRQETVSVSGKREVSEKRQTSATGKTQKKQRLVHIPLFFLHILLNGSPHSLRACIRSGFRLNCHHSPEKRPPVMQASQLAWYGNCWKRDLQHKTVQLDVQKPKFGHIFRTYIDLFLPLSFFPMPFFFRCSGTCSSSHCLCFARHFGWLTFQERDI